MTTRNILIVDDSKVSRSMMVYALRADGLRLLEAEGGDTALGVMQKEPVDMLITDLSMPGVDGFELVRQVRNLEGYAEVPIVMISGRVEDNVRDQALAAGVSVFLKKPFKPQQLYDLVWSVVN